MLRILDILLLARITGVVDRIDVKSGNIMSSGEYSFDKLPEPGETFTAKVDRISNSGNGIIECKHNHINVGPVTRDSKGEKIKAKMVEGNFAVCKSEEYKKESYPSDFPNFSSSKKSSSQNRSTVASSPEKSQPEITTTSSVEFCDDCGSMLKPAQNMWRCNSCGFEKIKPDKRESGQSNNTSESTGDGDEEPVSEGDSDSMEEGDEESESEESSESTESIDANSDNNSENSFQQIEDELEDSENSTRNIGSVGWGSHDSTQEEVSQTNTRDGDDDESQIDVPKETTDSSENARVETNIDELRKAAVEDAVEEVEKDLSTSSSQKSQYNRSSKVKKYVKARADGTCEGCGEPAPFTSTTGKPYLHAHHVHELSSGGSDTPETVVAICPNCHYRVHHGKDGEKFNQELLEFVQEKEGITE